MWSVHGRGLLLRGCRVSCFRFRLCARSLLSSRVLFLAGGCSSGSRFRPRSEGRVVACAPSCRRVGARPLEREGRRVELRSSFSTSASFDGWVSHSYAPRGTYTFTVHTTLYGTQCHYSTADSTQQTRFWANGRTSLQPSRGQTSTRALGGQSLPTLAPTDHQPGTFSREAAGFRNPPIACRSAAARASLLDCASGSLLAKAPQ